jgi:hypothetical protein
MHAANNIKFVNVQKAKDVYNKTNTDDAYLD